MTNVKTLCAHFPQSETPFSEIGNSIFRNRKLHFPKSVMVNATEMAKPFEKRPVDFLKSQSTNDFLDELTKVRKITLTDLVQVTYGNNGGTWMHEDVARRFNF